MWLAGMIALAAVLCAPARAQQASFVAGRDLDPRLYRAPSDGSGFIGLWGTEAPAPGQLAASLALDGAWDVLRLGRDPRAPLSTARDDHPLIDRAQGAVLGVHVGLPGGRSGAASLGLELPLLARSGRAYVIDGSYNAGRLSLLRSDGLGAPALVAKWAPFTVDGFGGVRARAFGVALIASAELDTGGTLRSDPDFALWPRVAAQWRPRAPSRAIELGVNAGYRYVAGPGPELRPPSASGSLRYGDLITAGAAVSLRVVGPLSLLAEVEGHQIARALGEARALAVELRGGARLALAQTHFTLAAGVGLAGGYSEADQRVIASVAFVLPRSDRDGDGLLDDRDACPGRAEDFDLYADGDGCPELDNDRDGVPDAVDECPAARGEASAGGCPRRAIDDRDGDGFDDYRDDCPDAPGERHGCPVEAASEPTPERGGATGGAAPRNVSEANPGAKRRGGRTASRADEVREAASEPTPERGGATGGVAPRNQSPEDTGGEP